MRAGRVGSRGRVLDFPYGAELQILYTRPSSSANHEHKVANTADRFTASKGRKRFEPCSLEFPLSAPDLNELVDERDSILF